MTEATKIALVKQMTDETDETVIAAFLDLAGMTVCKTAYPTAAVTDDLKTKALAEYPHVQVKAAAYLLNKRGADGQTSHGENGISRGYEAGDLPPSLLREIVPHCGVTG